MFWHWINSAYYHEITVLLKTWNETTLNNNKDNRNHACTNDDDDNYDDRYDDDDDVMIVTEQAWKTDLITDTERD